MYRTFIALAVAATALVACGDSTGPEGQATLNVAFATTAAPATDVSASLVPGDAPAAITADGSNGTLVLDEIWVIVAEFELEGELGTCDDTETDDDGDFDDDGCEEFESPPALVRIPTDGSALQVLSASVPLGLYTEMEWAVEDVELDDEEEDEQELAAVLSEVEAQFGSGVWPSEASMAVVGSFTPEGATEPQPFTTFIDAEIEVELALSPPLEITEAGASRELTIVFAPGAWFTRSDGSVVDLSAVAGQLIELEVEFENGVAEIERDDDDELDDDSDD